MTAPRLRNRTAAHAQRGAYAVEFALVFLIFFALLYGIISYGMLFAFRLGLQNAAEDGARAALRYQTDFPARAAQAQAVAAAQANWLPAIVNLQAVATVCQVANNNCAPAVAAACGITWDTRCQMVVTVTATNMGRLLPPMPLFGVPDQLVGRATMLLDARTP
ncbi:TadE/TadG family type IV pilus assembly protein [Variovorax guangxiensis]|uniref:Flp pilus assembly protein TadG n=1 Tax=Variovorax guangxiensis TaxID=1775474 RepID=A0A840FM09_9BURK|nr:TadE/TadG family type IV pilus assembly protein [Variovorax guangxiensis]MBB4223606.1 Flp pilus assembly protein TadG [Variovorax guangxiensis]